MDDKNLKYRSAPDIETQVKMILNIPLRDLDLTGRLSDKNKGSVGHVLEENVFGYKPNSESEPDFPVAGVELKTTAYVIDNHQEIRAKERLVITMINYMTEWNKTFIKSDFWKKSAKILVVLYQYRYGVDKGDFFFDHEFILKYPKEDLIIIKQDWNTIISKIKAGKAHLISGKDTLYLEACPKGVSSLDCREQPFSNEKAMRRAYALKSSYMTRLIKLEFGSSVTNEEHVITDLDELTQKGLENCLIDRLNPYCGMARSELMKRFDVSTCAKNLYEILLSKMLNLNGNVSETNEFKNAGIVFKTVRVEKDGHIKESMSFPAFKFTELAEEATWDNSQFKEYLESSIFMFVLFQKNDGDEYVFNGIKFWCMPEKDLNEVKKVWEKTVAVINDGIVDAYTWKNKRNNLPKQSENRVAHVRPHGKNSTDTYPLPNGGSYTKQCFWLNNTYIREVISGDE